MTRYPFTAIINGRPVVIWRDHIERTDYYGETADYGDPDQPAFATESRPDPLRLVRCTLERRT